MNFVIIELSYKGNEDTKKGDDSKFNWTTSNKC